jgi:hypothetical protein
LASGSGQPALDEIGGKPGFLVGAERVGDDELAEPNPDASAIIANHLGGEALGQAVRGEVGQSLRAGPLAPFEDAPGEEEPTASGPLKCCEHIR